MHIFYRLDTLLQVHQFTVHIPKLFADSCRPHSSFSISKETKSFQISWNYTREWIFLRIYHRLAYASFSLSASMLNLNDFIVSYSAKNLHLSFEFSFFFSPFFVSWKINFIKKRVSALLAFFSVLFSSTSTYVVIFQFKILGLLTSPIFFLFFL